MKINLSSLNQAFAAGAFGAFISSALVWWAGASRLNRALGISLHPDFTLEWLAPRIFLGGLLGFILLLPLSKITGWKKGILLSLVPTTLEFFISYPAAGEGNMALKAGLWAPFLVMACNALGCTAAVFWGKKTGGL